MSKPTAAALALLLCALTGCAGQPIRNKDPRDPWEGMNRAVWNFNDGFYRKVGLPISHAYIRTVPKPVQRGVTNFVSNFGYPTVILNDLLQAKFKQTASDTGRFLLNSTVGLGGLLDPGTAAGLLKHENDLGLTLGTWGVPQGPYFMIPFLGPSGVRDASARAASAYYITPQFYLPTYYALGFEVLWVLDNGANFLVPQYQLMDAQNVYDQYAFVRNLYLQRRYFLIHGQSPKTEQQQEEELEKSLQDSVDDTSPSAPSPKPPAPSPQPPAAPPQPSAPHP